MGVGLIVLSVAGTLIALGVDWLGNLFAVIAYFLLLGGTALALVQHGLGREGGSEANANPPIIIMEQSFVVLSDADPKGDNVHGTEIRRKL